MSFSKAEIARAASASAILLFEKLTSANLFQIEREKPPDYLLIMYMKNCLKDVLNFKRPSHGKLKLANSCWQTQVGVCERHKNSRQTCWQTVGDK